MRSLAIGRLGQWALRVNFALKLSEKSRRGVRRGLLGHGSGAIRPVLARHTDQISARSSARTPFQTVSVRSSQNTPSRDCLEIPNWLRFWVSGDTVTRMNGPFCALRARQRRAIQRVLRISRQSLYALQ